MFVALGVAVLLMYFVLVVQFGSFLEPLSILLSLPLSLIGVMLALLDHRRDAQHHEHDRRHPADGHRGEERHPADRLREVVGGGRDGAPRGADSGRARAPASDSDDDVRAGGRHGAGGPLGITVIGGVVTSTLLTLLVIPTCTRSWPTRAIGWERVSSARATRLFDEPGPRGRCTGRRRGARQTQLATGKVVGTLGVDRVIFSQCTTRLFPSHWKAGASCT